jgi:hypothetical protein
MITHDAISSRTMYVFGGAGNVDLGSPLPPIRTVTRLAFDHTT